MPCYEIKYLAFGPALASHQNGFTEAFFRLVRKIFRSIVGEATLDKFDLLSS